MERALAALPKAMGIITLAQRSPAESAQVKTADATLVTKTDKEVERWLVEAMSGIPGSRVRAEEGGESGDGDVTIWIDPLDGTRPFANRCATSTIIIAANHPDRGVIAVVIAEPSTGRIWTAAEDEPTLVMWYDSAADKISSTAREVLVWQGDLGAQSTTYLDLSQGFVRSGRQIMTTSQVAEFFASTATTTGIMMAGSNGLHEALVANGGDKVAAQVTTAIGGPWDVAGVLLVLQAGGVARAFSVNADRHLEEKDPTLADTYDILVSGNSAATVDRLVQNLFLAFRPI